MVGIDVSGRRWNQSDVKSTDEKIRQDNHSHIGHAAPQTGHNGLRVPAEYIHDKGPAETGEHRPCTVADFCSGFRCDERREGMHIGLDGQFGQCQHHSSKNVDDNL